MHLPFPSLQMKFALWIPQNTCLQQEVNQQSQYCRVFLLAGICLKKNRWKLHKTSISHDIHVFEKDQLSNDTRQPYLHPWNLTLWPTRPCWRAKPWTGAGWWKRCRKMVKMPWQLGVLNWGLGMIGGVRELNPTHKWLGVPSLRCENVGRSCWEDAEGWGRWGVW